MYSFCKVKNSVFTHFLYNFASKMNMNMKMNGKILIVMSIILTTLTSCVMDRKTTFFIRNCTNDTLLIGLLESYTLANWKDWNAEDFVTTNDTDEDKQALTKAIIGRFALPDSTLFVDPDVFFFKDTCYIYALKWQIAKHYTIEEIRAKKLYDRQAVTKKDFHDRLYEYRAKYNSTNH
jgi:hypothetical protein